MKREEDNIFDALMLRSPTVNGLKEAIAEKFELDYNKISKVLTIGNCRIDSEKREKRAQFSESILQFPNLLLQKY